MACLLFQPDMVSNPAPDATNLLVLEFRDMHATVELAGTQSRGALAIDWYDARKFRPNIRGIRKISRQMVFELMMASFAK